MKYALSLLLAIVLLGMLIPEKMQIPVQGASSSDWNHNTFWYEPWGSSGVHKGIDIFGKKGTPTLSATNGFVVYTGNLSKGGNVVAVLGPKWRIHYYAHLDSYSVSAGEYVDAGTVIGQLGDSGNAKGKQAHIHYSILSLIPIPWLATTETQGWKKMFFLNPHDKLL
ncbi:M23 family metallopeptidase [Ningiella sp. W23]|uniref:M23 family metallopeptidase n=1 Tax=Ningiella sp. W23 TaxID=3023715 RepID=UPI0037564B86